MKEIDDLHKMNLLEDVVADHVIYSTIMSAYTRSIDMKFLGQSTQLCFDKLVEIHEATEDEKYKLGVINFSTMLNA